MLERDPKTLARLQAVVTALIEHRVSTSLVDVEKALARWRDGDHSALAAHGAVLRHAARCERTVDRVTAAATDRPEGILRDAVDMGLMAEDEFIQLVGKPSQQIASIESMGDDEDASAPDKRRTLEQLLARGPVLVHVDARRAEVSVPPRFRADPSLVLRFGYKLTPAIGELVVDDDAIAGTLTFAGQPFRCILPWTAVYAAMVEGEQRGTVWPEDVPEDVLTGGGEPPAAVPAETKDSTSGALASVAPSAAANPASTSPSAAPSEAAPPRSKRASHLKLVE